MDASRVLLSVQRVIRRRIIGFAWSVELSVVGGMSLGKVTPGDIGRRVDMYWRWNLRLRGYGITKVTSESDNVLEEDVHKPGVGC